VLLLSHFFARYRPLSEKGIRDSFRTICLQLFSSALVVRVVPLIVYSVVPKIVMRGRSGSGGSFPAVVFAGQAQLAAVSNPAAIHKDLFI
jgi:hypothetical protein